MLIRPAITRHHPLKCHILVRRAGDGELLSGKGCHALFAFSAWISLLLPLPQAFSLIILLLLPFCYAVYSVMNGFISGWALFKKKKSWNRLQSVQLCRNKTHLTEKEKEIIEEGAAEDGKYRVQLHFTLMQKLSDPSLMKVFWTAGALTKKVLIRALRGQERM